MRVPNRLLPLASAAKRYMVAIGAYFVRRYPGIFKGEKINLSIEEAEAQIYEIYTDIESSSLCDNIVCPQYDLHIIVPAYNVEKYITKCIDSIIDQKTSYTYFITIVNDGSTDSTKDILARYESYTNIAIINNQSNSGYSGARNSALKHIKGRYLMFVDSDDFLSDGALTKLLDAGTSRNADIVQGSFNHFDKQGVFDKKILKDDCSYISGQVEILSYPWGKIFKSTLFEHLCFPEGYWYEDTITKFILVPNSGLKITLSEIVYNYRHHRGTVMIRSKNPFRCLDALFVTRSILRDCAIIRRVWVDEYLFDHFLHQVIWNFDRIKSIKRDSINKSSFVLHAHLFNKYFKQFRYKSKKFPVMQRALEDGDYSLYRIACRFYT